MKVLSKPPNTSWTLRHLCSSCRALLEIEPADLFHQPEYHDFRVYVICLSCGAVTEVNHHDIPEDVLRKVPTIDPTKR